MAASIRFDIAIIVISLFAYLPAGAVDDADDEVESAPRTEQRSSTVRVQQIENQTSLIRYPESLSSADLKNADSQFLKRIEQKELLIKIQDWSQSHSEILAQLNQAKYSKQEIPYLKQLYDAAFPPFNLAAFVPANPVDPDVLKTRLDFCESTFGANDWRTVDIRIQLSHDAAFSSKNQDAKNLILATFTNRMNITDASQVVEKLRVDRKSIVQHLGNVDLATLALFAKHVNALQWMPMDESGRASTIALNEAASICRSLVEALAIEYPEGGPWQIQAANILTDIELRSNDMKRIQKAIIDASRLKASPQPSDAQTALARIVVLAEFFERTSQWPQAEESFMAANELAQRVLGTVSEESISTELSVNRIRVLSKLNQTQLREFNSLIAEFQSKTSIDPRFGISRMQFGRRQSSNAGKIDLNDIRFPQLNLSVSRIFISSDAILRRPLQVPPKKGNSDFANSSPIAPTFSRRESADSIPDELKNCGVAGVQKLREKYVEFLPSDTFVISRLHVLEGEVCETTGKTDQAIAKYSESLKLIESLNLNDTMSSRNLRQAIDGVLTKKLREAAEARDWKLAVSDASRLMEWRSKALGSNHWATRDAQIVLELAQKYLKLSSDGVEYLLETEEALSSVESDDATAYRANGFSGGKNGREAIAQLGETIRRRSSIFGNKDPWNTRLMMAKAKIERGVGNLDRAMVLYSSVDRQLESMGSHLNPDLVSLHDQLSQLALEMGNTEERNRYSAKVQVIGKHIGWEYVPVYRFEDRTMTVVVQTGSPLQVIRRLETQFSGEIDRCDFVNAEKTARSLIDETSKFHGESSSETALARINLTSVWAETGDLVEAEKSFRASLETLKLANAENSLSFAKVRHNLAFVCERLGRFQEADQLLTEALSVAMLAGDSSVVPMRTARVKILQRLGKIDEASIEIAEVLTQMKSTPIEQTRAGIEALIESGFVNSLAKKFDRAKENLNTAEKLIGDNQDLLVDLHYCRGVLSFESGDTEQAISELTVAARLALARVDVASQFQSTRQQVAAATSARQYIDALLTVCEIKPPKNLTDIYCVTAALKGVGTRRVSEIRQLLNDPQLSEINAQVAKSLATIQRLSSEISTNQFNNPSFFDNSEPAKKKTKLQLRTEIDRARKQLELGERELALMLRDVRERLSDTDVKHIATSIPDDGVLVDVVAYRRFPWRVQSDDQPDGLATFLVYNDASISWVHLGNDNDVNSLIKKWNAEKYISKTDDEDSPGRILRNQVWDPIERNLNVNDRLILICPDGALCLLPWVALPGRKKNQFLLEEDRRFVQVPTPQFLIQVNRSGNENRPVGEVPQSIPIEPFNRPAASLELLLVGDLNFGAAHDADSSGLHRWSNLPNTAKELRTLRGLFEETYPQTNFQYQQYVKQLGQRHAILSVLKNCHWVHFATHGFFSKVPAGMRTSDFSAWYFDRSNDRHALGPVAMSTLYPGLFSGLALTDANITSNQYQQPGVITALDIGCMDLSHTELVVLSACETALGDYERGEGQLSLQNAFHRAGVRTCVSSLWKVPDSATATLMERFYENVWVKRLSKLESLREAQLSILHDDGIRGIVFDDDPSAKKTSVPPYYWSAFLLSGYWR